MPLRDHFHPPLYPKRTWESLHNRWASSLADWVNQHLPSSEFFAEVQTHLGPIVEIDGPTFEQVGTAPGSRPNGAATATLPAQVWTPPAAALVMPAVFPDTFEVRVFGTERGGLDLVAAIELVSPGNKDRPEKRRASAVKYASYLFQGVSLIIVDIVTALQANLHNELSGLLEAAEPLKLPPGNTLYTVAYRPILREGKPEIDIWPATFTLDSSLPLLPLGLTRGLCIPVDFEATYTEACQRLKLPGS